MWRDCKGDKYQHVTLQTRWTGFLPEHCLMYSLCFHREQKTKQLPYRRLLSTIPIHDHGGDLEIDRLPGMEPEVSQDAVATARHISTLFGRAAGNRRWFGI